jgi:hypothetical protein
MNKNIIITILVLLVLAGVGYYFFTKFRVSTLSPELSQPTALPTEVPVTSTPEVAPKEIIIKITANS